MTPKGYSATQIALHWIVAILILSQYLLAEGMEEAWEVVEDGGQAVTTTGALIHIVIGAAVFLFALWRLSLRFSRGAPGPAGAAEERHHPAHPRLPARFAVAQPGGRPRSVRSISDAAGHQPESPHHARPARISTTGF